MDGHNDNDGFQPVRLTVRIPTALEMLGIGRSKMYELIGSGEIEVIKIGKATLVLVQSIHEFVRRQRMVAAA